MVLSASKYIVERLSFKPSIGLVLGSGLGPLADAIESPATIDYKDIPGFAVSTAPSHRGRLVGGMLSGKKVLCMQGRLHLYEGHSISDVVFPIKVMHAMGIETLIVTNAAGGINTGFSVGDIMVIADHINFMGQNPLIGPHDPSLGPRFNDMTTAYTPSLRKLAHDTAKQLGLSLREGVYLGCLGPSFETPAEIRAFRTLGADAVGMSTVPEVIMAANCSMRVLGLSLITNMAAGVTAGPVSGDEVNEVGDRMSTVMQRLVSALIKGI